MNNLLDFLKSNFEPSSWKYFIIVGIIFVIIGCLAISLPVLTGLAISTIIGFFLIVGSITQLFHSIALKTWRNKTWYNISTFIYLITGILILLNPYLGEFTITYLFIVFLTANGLAHILFGIYNKQLSTSKLIIISGIFSVLIGLYFLFLLENPETSTSLLGILIGISLILEGISFISLGAKLKSIFLVK